jgi:carbonic anhydrase/acetyltransferase-like protein (isoleucine patch superfamily)
MPFIHKSALVLGNVTLKSRASVWPFAVIRGDTERIEIGEDSNIQDGTVVHADRGFPTIIGDRVGVGHRAIIHGAIVEPDSLIGMGAILLNGVRVGTGSIIAAGAVCKEGMQIPPNSMVMGVPGRIVRETTTLERERIRDTVDSYVKLQAEHRAGDHPLVLGDRVLEPGGRHRTSDLGPRISK